MSSSEFGSAMLVINYLSSYNFITQESFAFGTWSVVTNCEHNLVIGDSQTESQWKAKLTVSIGSVVSKILSQLDGATIENIPQAQLSLRLTKAKMLITKNIF